MLSTTLARAAAAGAVLLAGLAPTVHASQSDGANLPAGSPGGLAATPARIEMGVGGEARDVSTEVSVTNRGPQPTHVHAQLRDLVVTQAGAYAAVPVGETPYSIASMAEIDQADLFLDPSGQPGATGVVHLSSTLDQLDRPRYGALSLDLEESKAAPVDFGGVRVAPQLRPSILIPILVVPMAPAEAAAGGEVGTGHLAESISLQLQALALNVGQAEQNGLLDQAIPVALPGLADHGALLAATDVVNTGNAFGRAFTTFEFTAVNPLSFLPQPLRGMVGDERPFLQAQAAPAALMPDMRGQTHASTRYEPMPGSIADSTPWFGLVRVRATTSLLLADVASPAVVQDAYVLVLPWKEGLVVLTLWTLWHVWQRRRRQPGGRLVELAPLNQSAEAA